MYAQRSGLGLGQLIITTRDKVLSYLRYEMNGWNALPRCVVGVVRGEGSSS